MCGGSGGSQTGTTQYNWNPTMEAWWSGNSTGTWPGLIQYAADNSISQPYRGYTADAQAQAGAQNTGQRIAGLTPDQIAAGDSIRNFTLSGGSPVTQAANGQLQKTLQGDYLNGPDANPYMGLNSQYFQDTLNQGLGDITDAYKRGTASDTARSAALAGVFGGSDHGQAVAANEYNLGKSLGQYTSGMQNDQYNRSGQMYQTERANQLAAVPGGQNEQALSLQRANALMGVGDVNQQLNQQGLNLNYQNWLDQTGWNRNQIDYMTGLLSKAQGGIGGSVQQTPATYGISPASGLLSAALAYGALRTPS